MYSVIFKLEFKASFKLVRITILFCVLQDQNYFYFSNFILLKHNRISTNLYYYLIN